MKGGKAPAKGAPAKGAPAKPDPKKAPVVAVPDENEEKNKRPLPEPHQHVNQEIRDFLLHFKSDRLIHISCDKATQARQREPEETVKLLETRVKDRETAQKEIEAEH